MLLRIVTLGALSFVGIIELLATPISEAASDLFTVRISPTRQIIVNTPKKAAMRPSVSHDVFAMTSSSLNAKNSVSAAVPTIAIK